jgi:hypothetical protein
MTVRPPDGSEESEASDPVMLAVLSNRGRSGSLLSPEEERLLDDWVAGHLAGEAAERAAALVKRNRLAAEYVLERRLLDAARQGSPVPPSLEARIVGAAPAARASAFGGWWRSLGRRQWLGVAGVAALACVAAIAVAPMLQQTMRDGAPLQVALATFGDRTALFEPSDSRVRGPGPPPAPADQRFRDVEIPLRILRTVLASGDGSSQAAAAREISPYLTNASRPLYVVVDAALKRRLETAAGEDRVPVRIYDLDDPRSSNVRSLVGPIPAGRQAYLLSVKP